MGPDPEPTLPLGNVFTLAADEASALRAIRRGVDRKSALAVTIGRDLRSTAIVLDTLKRATLIRQNASFTWQATAVGLGCDIRARAEHTTVRRRLNKGRSSKRGAAVRMLKLLQRRPWSGRDLVKRLGVTPQRIHQLIIDLHAQGLIRLGDPALPSHIVAQKESTWLLLDRSASRLLSTFPVEVDATGPALRLAAGLTTENFRSALDSLLAAGLVAPGTIRDRGETYRLSDTGRGHFQRAKGTRTAKPARLTVESTRVRRVLSYLAARGSARIKDVAGSLRIAPQSMNALAQYLKRRGLVAKITSDANAPYALTDVGGATLLEMLRRE